MGRAPRPEHLLFGRDSESLALVQALHETRSWRRTHTVLTTGPAGQGKTALVSTFAARAAISGSVVLYGRADPMDSGAPYGIFRTAVASLNRTGRSQNAQEIADQLDHGFDFAAWQSPSAESTRTEIFAREIRVLFRSLVEEPRVTAVVVIVDDLHDADPDSIALFAALARSVADIPVLLLPISRAAEGAAPRIHAFIDRLQQDGLASVVDLKPLSRAAISEWLSVLTGTPADETILDEVFRGSRGNAFFVRELFRTDTTTSLTNDPATVSLNRFFEPDSSEARTAENLALLSHISAPFLPVLAELVDQTTEQLSASVERLRDRGLLEETSGGYDFVHPLLKATLYHQLGKLERTRRHGVIAAALSRARRDGRPVDVFELATHTFRASESADPVIIPLAIEAATTSIGTAPLTAARWFERAANAAASDPVAAARLRTSQVLALSIGARTAEAVTVAERTVADAPDEFDRSELIFAVNCLLFASDRLSEAIKVNDREIAVNDQNIAARVGRVYLLSQAGRTREAAELYPSALREAHELKRDRTIVAATAYCQLASYANLVGRYADHDQLAIEAVNSMRLHEPVLVADQMNFLATFPVGSAGSLRRARAHAASADRARGVRLVTSTCGYSELSIAATSWYAGEWDELAQVCAAAIPEEELSGTLNPSHSLRAFAALVEAARGKPNAAAILAPVEAAPSEDARSLVALARSAAAAGSGDAATAERLLAARYEEARERGSLTLLPLLCEEYVRLLLVRGEVGVARSLAHSVLTEVASLGSPLNTMWAYRAVALVDSDPDAAAMALDLISKQDVPFERARCLLELGATVGDADALREAWNGFSTLRASPWRRRAEQALRRHGYPVPRRRRRGEELSDLDRSIVELVRASLSNREIGDRLGYSSKTIETYLSRIYSTLHVRSRIGLAQLDPDTL